MIWLCWGLMTHQPLWIILWNEKGREEIVEEMKERDREEKGTGMKVKETEEIKTFPLCSYLLQG